MAELAGNPGAICLGKIVRVQGLRGEFRVNPYGGDPDVFRRIKTVRFEKGNEVAITAARSHKNQAIVKLAGVETIEAAAALVNQELWVLREQLPRPPKGEFYWTDLVGHKVLENGVELGTVRALDDVGAHDVLIVDRPNGGEVLIPFVESMIKNVDQRAKTIDVELPLGLVDLEEADE